MAELTTGSVFAGYRIEGTAGSGGMGVVWRATQLALDRPVALKLIAPELANDPMFRERFKRESQLAASIDHPNVIPVYEAGEAEGRLFIAMRYVPGQDLQTLLREEQPYVDRVLRLVSQIAAALDAAHRQGLVHRDVKPANVLVTGQGAEEHAYLTDFGLTKRTTAASGLTRTGEFVGTLDYVAPEQIEGKPADARADVYALGCMLFHALTGQRPFERESDVAKLYAHLNDAPPVVTESMPGAPRGLDAVVARALAKDPEERYPSAGDLARAARAAIEGDALEAPERSVARGAAAPGTATVPAAVPGTPTVPAAAAGTPTVPAEAPPEAPPAGAVSGSPEPETRVIHRAPRRGLFIGAGVVVIAIAGAAVALLAGGGDGDGGGGGGQEITTPKGSAPPSVAATIRVGRRPDGLAVAGNSVLVANAADDTASLIDAGSNKIVGSPIPAGGNPDSVVGAKGVFWVTATDDNAVRRIETSPDVAEGGTVPVGLAPEGVGLGKQLVWVANAGDGTVSRVDRASAAPVGDPIRVGKEPAGVFVGPDTVWVANSGDDTVSRFDPSTADPIGDPIRVGDYPRAIVEAEGFAWVTNARDDTVTRIDAGTGRVADKPIRVGRTPRDITFGAGHVWVGNSAGNTVSRIDAGSARVVGSPIPVGRTPIGVAFGAGAVWVANQLDGTVTRITP